MRKNLYVLMMILAFAAICFAQQTDADKQMNGQDKMMPPTGTQFSAELLDTIDVEKSKRSDNFQLQLNEDLKIGDKMLAKGTKINGRIVKSKKMSKDKEVSLVSLYVGSVNEGKNYFRFNAAIVAVGDANEPGETMTFVPAQNFKGATVISMKGKNIKFEKGTIIRLTLDEPAK